MKMRKFTKEEIEKLKKYWKKLQVLEDEYFIKVHLLEKAMQRNLKIDDLEFFESDDGYCGIGNLSRTIKLIQADELESE